ncbi:MAG TPA: 16S rRNA (cytidine(1402)-2'-O)-methyltransferase [Candidatus Aphodovivens excrementavium]|nr:16S rRNA (cytidine(1402)-2'-O)-methyltransferase [Candidatus Aphodovivens excrementavium]
MTLRAAKEGASGEVERGSAASSGGRLIVVPTPLGNLGDVTQRALDALRAADVVCAEDTRVTGKLLAAFDIQKRLERLDEAMAAQRATDIVRRVRAGETIAYCSDAGMPGVSDPGMRLVRACREAGAAVEVLPGPTAVATAYVASGCDNQKFYFGGFFPRKAGERRAALEALRTLDAALVFYESPNRLVGALEAIAEAFPLRTATVCRELTKLHEEIVRDATPGLRDEFARREKESGIKGEIVIVIDGPSKQEEAVRTQDAAADARTRAAQLAAEGVRAKQIAKTVAAELGISRNEAYEIALEACRS